ncbi:MAG: hypothetical protein ACQEV0_14760 [Bacillota bacterium]
MESIYEWMGVIQLGVFVLAGLLMPFWLKSYVWLVFVAIGYVVYLAWGMYLRFSSYNEDFWVGYGSMIIPYLAGISLIGYLLQKSSDYTKRNGSEE